MPSSGVVLSTGQSAATTGHVVGSRPPGSLVPSSTSARAPPASWPGHTAPPPPPAGGAGGWTRAPSPPPPRPAGEQRPAPGGGEKPREKAGAAGPPAPAKHPGAAGGGGKGAGPADRQPVDAAGGG